MLIDKEYPSVPEDWEEIIAGLIELRKQKRFHTFYVDNYVIRIQWHIWDHRDSWEVISHSQARTLLIQRKDVDRIYDSIRANQTVAGS